MSRDWMKSLFPSSFMGTPFWTEKDSGTTGRRLQISELPGVDDPDIEDLGRSSRHFEFTAYTIGDAADAAMDALEQVCGMEGPGTLVLPAQGPVQVHCESFRRSREKNKMGFFSAEMRFVRAPSGQNATSPAWLEQLAFNATQSLSAASAGFLNAGLSL